MEPVDDMIPGVRSLASILAQGAASAARRMKVSFEVEDPIEQPASLEVTDRRGSNASSLLINDDGMSGVDK